MLRAGYPTLLAWKGRYDLSRLKTSRCYYHTLSENGNRVFTHSMLIKMYKFTIQGMCLYMYIIFTVSQFHADVHSVYFVFLFDTTILSESMSTSNMFWWDLKSSKSKEHFKFHSLYSLLICSISACSRHQYLLPWLNFSCVYHLTCRKKEQKKEKQEPLFSNRELLSTRKHWTINPSLAQAPHRFYRHIALISFQLKTSTPFMKLSTTNNNNNNKQTTTKKKNKKNIAFKSFFVLF